MGVLHAQQPAHFIFVRFFKKIRAYFDWMIKYPTKSSHRFRRNNAFQIEPNLVTCREIPAVFHIQIIAMSVFIMQPQWVNLTK